MRSKGIAVLLLQWVVVATALAQGGKRFTLEEVTPGSRAYWQLVPKQPSVLAVLDEGLLLHNKEGDVVLRHLGGAETPFYQHKGRLRVEQGFLVEQEEAEVRVMQLPSLQVVSEHRVPEGGGAFHVSPCGRYLVHLTPNPIITTAKGEVRQLTSDASADVVYCQPAHRHEFGIERGVFFSPSGRYFAFYRANQSKVTSYPILHTELPITTNKPIKYPMAGQASEEVQVGIYDMQSGSVTYLQTGAPHDRYFTNLAWDSSEQFLYIDEVNRAQNEVRLVKYSRESGKPLHTLLTEQNERYIEPTTPVYFYTGGKGTFIRLSRVDGWRHLYLYNAQGQLVRRLTGGEWEVKEYLGTDPLGRYAYFTSNRHHTTGQDLYRVALRNGKVELLTGGDGWYGVRMSPSKSMAYVTYTSKEVPSRTALYTLGRRVKHYPVSEAENPLASYQQPQVELGTLTASTGEPLHYKITLPPQLEEGKKYPVIVYVYGGPHSQLVTDTWRSLHLTWDTYMAQEGYVVFTLDNRGTDNRGMAFESVTHRQLGKAEMEDQMVGVEYLRGLPFVDANRIGVYGWSFGGFMATNLMLTHPNTFKVGVAGGPVMDWRYYEVMYGERYMDTPNENPQGYEASSLIKRAHNLQGRLLLIHGALDPVVLWQHSLLFLKEAVPARVYPDYMVYPAHEHNVRGEDRVHLHHVIARYFHDFL